MRDDFCAFILSHGRPDRVHTYRTLLRAGYTGKIYIVIDDEDKTADEYRKIYGDKVLQFCKREYAAKLDEGDNTGKRTSTIYARAAMFDLAPQVGCKYFIQLDDDYTSFQFRANSKGAGCYAMMRQTLDDCFSAMLDFFLATPAKAITLAQGGDFMGGVDGQTSIRRLRRKAMNSFICSTDRPWMMLGRMNEDVNTYVTEGRRGDLFFTVVQVMLVQKATQLNAGGMSELYLDSGTYVKSFYTVMYAPSCAQIGVLGDPRGERFRIHHKLNWHRIAPQILREEHKKQPRSLPAA
jgi:hypothetical protein